MGKKTVRITFPIFSDEENKGLYEQVDCWLGDARCTYGEGISLNGEQKMIPDPLLVDDFEAIREVMDRVTWDELEPEDVISRGFDKQMLQDMGAVGMARFRIKMNSAKKVGYAIQTYPALMSECWYGSKEYNVLKWIGEQLLSKEWGEAGRRAS